MTSISVDPRFKFCRKQCTYFYNLNYSRKRYVGMKLKLREVFKRDKKGDGLPRKEQNTEFIVEGSVISLIFCF